MLATCRFHAVILVARSNGNTVPSMRADTPYGNKAAN